MKRQVATTITISLLVLLFCNTGFSQTQMRNPDDRLGTTLTNEFKINNDDQQSIYQKDINVIWALVGQTFSSIETDVRIDAINVSSAGLSLSVTDANTFETYYLCENMVIEVVGNNIIRVGGDLSLLSQSMFHAMKLRIVFYNEEGNPVGVFMDTRQIQTIY